MPILKFNRAFLQSAKKPVSFAVERSNGQVAVCNTFIHGTPEMREADHYYADRLVKSMLWLQGGFKVYISGDEDVYNYLKETFSLTGKRAFDADFMAGVYERPSRSSSATRYPRRRVLPRPSAATWTAAASALTPAEATARCPL